jgi:DNA-binding NarL/FixJ family response regulator
MLGVWGESKRKTLSLYLRLSFYRENTTKSCRVFPIIIKLGKAFYMKKVNILIVDDHALFRQGLRALLVKEPFVNAIYEAEDADTFLRQLTSTDIQVILLDVRLKRTNGFELMKKIKPEDGSPAIIAVTSLGGTEVIIDLLKVGVQGIIYKSDDYSEIVKTIKAVLHSKSYFPESVLEVIRDNIQQWNEVSSVVTLLPYEKDILKAIAEGATTKEIARDLKMSPKTVETYRLRLMKRLRTSNSAVLVAYAFKNGIL